MSQMQPEYGSAIEAIARGNITQSQNRMRSQMKLINAYVRQQSRGRSRPPKLRQPVKMPGRDKGPRSKGPPVGMNAGPFAKEVRDPLKDYTITSPFGMRTNPFTGERSFHTGIDLAAPKGTPIYAAASGRIGKRTGWSDIYGNEIIIQHGGGWKTGYHHLARMLVKAGQRVRKGQIIGYVGSTGYSTGPHLHWSVYRRGDEINPRRFL